MDLNASQIFIQVLDVVKFIVLLYGMWSNIINPKWPVLLVKIEYGFDDKCGYFLTM